MSRPFKRVDYEKVIHLSVRLGDCIGPDHLARFVVALVAMFDLSAIYRQYSTRGAPPYAPELLVGLLFYGYATGVFSSRKIELATYEHLAFRFIAGDFHPDHDTIAEFRRRFLPQLEGLFTQLLLIAQEAGVLKLGNISLDGTKLHADASKSRAVSYQRAGELEAQLRQEVNELLALAERVDQGGALPDGLVITEELQRRQERLLNLAEAKRVIEARAQARFQQEEASYQAKLAEREAKAQATGHKPKGRAPFPPTPGPQPTDQYNFTDPESQIMKNSTNKGFDQHYNAQVAVDQTSLLIVGHSLSNHPSDFAEVQPTVATIPEPLGRSSGAALDTGYFSQENVRFLGQQGIEPYIATGRDHHHQSWQARFAHAPEPPAADASLRVQMAYKLQTEIGHAIYRLRKCTVEPVIGIIKETLGFRQFSLRGLIKVAGEWTLVCLAFNLKRLHKLLPATATLPVISPTGC